MWMKAKQPFFSCEERVVDDGRAGAAAGIEPECPMKGVGEAAPRRLKAAARAPPDHGDGCGCAE